MDNNTKIQDSLGVTFSNLGLLSQAFIHRSYLNESRRLGLSSNERLEFLGDAVLELVVSEFLYHKLPSHPEGDLTSFRSSLVKTETLAQVAINLDLGSHLKMSKGEELSGGRANTSLLANTVEAVLGALYLDQGLPAVASFCREHLFGYLEEIMAKNLHRDFKSSLQELVQAKNQPTPVYTTVSAIGPDHHKTFVVEVRVGDKPLAQGSGPSKQKAQQAAAKTALAKLEAA